MSQVTRTRKRADESVGHYYPAPEHLTKLTPAERDALPCEGVVICRHVRSGIHEMGYVIGRFTADGEKCLVLRPSQRLYDLVRPDGPAKGVPSSGPWGCAEKHCEWVLRYADDDPHTMLDAYKATAQLEKELVSSGRVCSWLVEVFADQTPEGRQWGRELTEKALAKIE